MSLTISYECIEFARLVNVNAAIMVITDSVRSAQRTEIGPVALPMREGTGNHAPLNAEDVAARCLGIRMLSGVNHAPQRRAAKESEPPGLQSQEEPELAHGCADACLGNLQHLENLRSSRAKSVARLRDCAGTTITKPAHSADGFAIRAIVVSGISETTLTRCWQRQNI